MDSFQGLQVKILCCGQWSIIYLAQLQIELLFLQIYGLIQGGLLCGLPCHRKSGIKLAKKGAIRHWENRGLCARLPCASEAASWLWQREGSFVLSNMPEDGTQSTFCRAGCEVELKQFYLLSYFSEAVMWSRKFGRGDCRAKYRMCSLAFMLRSCQVLGRELYLTLQSCVDGAVEIKYLLL